MGRVCGCSFLGFNNFFFLDLYRLLENIAFVSCFLIWFKNFVCRVRVFSEGF